MSPVSALGLPPNNPEKNHASEQNKTHYSFLEFVSKYYNRIRNSLLGYFVYDQSIFPIGTSVTRVIPAISVKKSLNEDSGL